MANCPSNQEINRLVTEKLCIFQCKTWVNFGCKSTLLPLMPDSLISQEQGSSFNLETAVGREKDVQDIDVHGEFEKRVVTLLVMSAFS